MTIRGNRGFGAAALLVLVAILGIVSATLFALVRLATTTERTESMQEEARRFAERTIQISISALSTRESHDPFGDPRMGFFSDGGDLDSDGVISRDGEDPGDDFGTDGTPNLLEPGFDSAHHDPSRDDDNDGRGPDGVAGTVDDRQGTEGNGRFDGPDGQLHGPRGAPLGLDVRDVGIDGVPDVREAGFDASDNPDPDRDDYHPIMNPGATELNGWLDPGFPGDPTNPGEGNSTSDPGVVLHTVESGDAKWRGRGSRVRQLRSVRHASRLLDDRGRSVSVTDTDAMVDGLSYIRVIDSQSRLDVNGPDVLTARLLNALLLTTNLCAACAAPEISYPANGRDDDHDGVIDDQAIGRNGRGIEYDEALDDALTSGRIPRRSDGTIDWDSAGQDAVAADDAMRIVRYRDSLPEGRFQSLDQILEVKRASGQPIFGMLDGDEFLRLRDFLTVNATRDAEAIRGAGFVHESRAPIDVNTAPVEALAAVMLVGLTPDRGAAPLDVRASAAETIALETLRYRMKQNRRRSDGSAAYHRAGTIRSFDQLDEFFGEFVAALGDSGVVQAFAIDPSIRDAVRDLLRANRERLLVQANPNARLRRFNPDLAAAYSIDKTDIEDPTTEFCLSTFGIYELTILTRIVTGQSLVPNSILPGEPHPLRDAQDHPLINGRILYQSDRELARYETRIVVRLASRWREGTQADFERTEPEFLAGRRRCMAESFPEHRAGETLSTPFLSSPLSVGINADVVVIDERSGIAYAASGGSVQPIEWDAAGPRPLDPVSGVSVDARLAFDGAFQREGAGRLYSTSSSGDLRAIDLVASGARIRARSVTSLFAGTQVERVLPVPERRAFFALLSGGRLAFAAYPLADPAAMPEIDDLSTPDVDEAHDGVDNDGDGVIDDGPSSPAGRPGDDPNSPSGDAVWPSPTHPTFDASATLGLGTVLDATYDSTAVQLFAATASGTLVRVGVDTELRPVLLETVSIAGAPIVRLVADGAGTWLYLLRQDGSIERRAQRLALDVVVSSHADVFAGDTPRDLAVDAPDGILFALSSSSLVAVDARSRTLDPLPPVAVSSGARRVALDPLRDRLFVVGGSDLQAFTFSMGLESKRFDRDGSVRLRCDAQSAGPTSDILARAGFDDDVRLRTADGAVIPAFVRDVATHAAVPLPRSVFDRSTGVLLPDGMLLGARTDSAAAISGEVVFVDTGALFPDVDGTNDALSGGFRDGAFEFWVKLSRISPARAPSSLVLYEAYSSGTIDPEAFVDKEPSLTREQEAERVVSSVQPILSFRFDRARVGFAAFTRITLEGFVDTDGDGFVDQATMTLDRWAQPTEPITISGAFGPAPGTPFSALAFPATAFAHARIAALTPIQGGAWMNVAATHRQVENPWAIPETTVDGIDDDGDGVVDDVSGPAATPEANTTNGIDDDGDGRIDDGLVREGPLVRLYVNGQWRRRAGVTSTADDLPMPTGLDADGAAWVIFGPMIPPSAAQPGKEVLATVDDLCLYRRAAALEQPRLRPERFAPFEAFVDANGNGVRDAGEPFEDDDLSGTRNPVGTKFRDANGNGTFDPGEAYDMGGGGRYDATGRLYRTYGEPYLDWNHNDEHDATGEPFFDGNGDDFQDEREPYLDLDHDGKWEWVGEPWVDSGPGDPTHLGSATYLDNGKYDVGEVWQDVNGNGVYDFGEIYVDFSNNGQYDLGERYQDLDRSRSFDGGEGHANAAADRNHDGRVDGRGSYFGVIPLLLSPGTRVGAASFNVVIPPGSAIEAEFTLRAFGGNVLARWSGIAGTLGGVPLDLFVREPCYVEYRFDFHVARGSFASPILEDVALSLMGDPEVLSREVVREPLMTDLERGWLHPLGRP
ncbi:MAG: hypothetical protein HYR85_27620 [Planctomycetes bacterium]|nr:hypothetical protein [Planctomycetota bacterium]